MNAAAAILALVAAVSFALAATLWHAVVAVGALAGALVGAVVIATASNQEPANVQVAVA